MWLAIGLAATAIIVVVVAIAAWSLKPGQAQNLLAGLRWCLTSENTYARVFRHALLVVFVVLFLLAIKWYAVGVAEEKAEKWMTSYNGVVTTSVVGPIKADAASPLAATSPTPLLTNTEAQSTNADTTTMVAAANAPGPATPTPTPTPTVAEQQRIDAQLRTIRDRIKHHGDVMAFFYVNYFVAIVMVMVGGLFVAVTLFMIAQKGWTGTSSYVEAIFIVASMWVAFFGLFPPVFQQDKNITDNKALFLEYKGLETEVESYPVTYLTLKSEPKLPREFINHVDMEMDRLGNIALGFDVDKISYQEAITLSKEKPANTNTNAPPTNSNAKPK